MHPGDNATNGQLVKADYINLCYGSLVRRMTPIAPDILEDILAAPEPGRLTIRCKDLFRKRDFLLPLTGPASSSLMLRPSPAP